ncbi:MULTISPECIES: sulfur carrier protein ThiS [Caldimonas]|jgi:sulfur carrier protein|uniref:sulfur carrier protein ThiS n=1 Tax=Caldimonas TaxID=196013 RepID=UPI00036BFE26|nr:MULTISPECIES: sulfur carrier protein ThiS [Caldimonas]MCX7659071.1 sulfur carrier protein ThiS [Caldimonas manganoxidans]GIX25176.1 MAG: hypothetical protein KatS3mg122_2407 [Caldimonas sp.]
MTHTDVSSATCQVRVNDEVHRIQVGTTLAQLLALRGLEPQSVATALNGEFVPRSERSHCVLRDGDCVTCFQPIVGG